MKIQLNLSADSLPVHAVVVAAGSHVDATIESATGESSLVHDGTTIEGSVNIVKYLARQLPAFKLYGDSPAATSSVDSWIDFTNTNLKTNDFSKIGATLEALDTHLRMRVYLVGYTLTLADLVVFDALRVSPAWTKNVKSGSASEKTPHVHRWFTFIDLDDNVQAALKSVKGGSAAKPKQTKDQASYAIDLPGAVKGKVVTRFPPEPSGYLHIGHAKAALLNEYFAREFDGKLIVRFDDTNPSKEKEEYEHAITEDLEMLNIKADLVTHTSDYFDVTLKYAEQLIDSGLAYADDTPQEQMRKERMDGIASKNRDLSVAENRRRFEEMKKGTEFGQAHCLRAKMSVDAKNKALRDPVIYRCNFLPHARTGDKFKVYPTYDFACPIVDSIEGVTHSLRTNEYHDRNDQFYWFIEKLGIRKPHIWDYSRMNFVYTLLSKRKLTWFVDEKRVTGWDDPRFPTIRGILRRGLTVDALKEYIYMQGPSKNILLLEWDKLWAVNRKILDPITPRFTAIAADSKVLLHIVDGPAKPFAKEVPKHKKNPDLGNKLTVFANEVFIEGEDAAEIADSEEFTLMDWGNVITTKIHRDASGKVTKMEGKLNLGGDVKKTKKLTWIANTESAIPVTLLDYDFLITKKKIEEDEDFEDFLNPETEFSVSALGDGNLATLKKGAKIQLERRGYYICDEEYKKGSSLKLIFIPDGKNKSVTGVSAKGDAETETSTKVSAPAKISAPASTSKAASSTSSSSQDFTSPEAFAKSVSSMYHLPPVNELGGSIDAASISKMYLLPPLYTISGPSTSAPAPIPKKQTAASAPAPAAATSSAPASSAPAAKDEKKKGKAPAAAAAAPAATADDDEHPFSKVDMRVGRVLSVKKHPDADTLYVEEIDIGEDKPRTVCSGLVKYLQPEDIDKKDVVLVCNLKPANMRGVTSAAMLLAASNPEHTIVELLIPPAGSKPGDRVFVKGHEAQTYEILNPKKKIWEKVQPDLHTNAEGTAVFMDLPLETKNGIVKVKSIFNGNIK